MQSRSSSQEQRRSTSVATERLFCSNACTATLRCFPSKEGREEGIYMETEGRNKRQTLNSAPSLSKQAWRSQPCASSSKVCVSARAAPAPHVAPTPNWPSGSARSPAQANPWLAPPAFRATVPPTVGAPAARQEQQLHRSPAAGWPESALATAAAFR